MKFEGAESELSLLLKKNIMQWPEIQLWEANVYYNHSAIKVIKVSTQRAFKHMFFQTHRLALFIYTLFTGERRESIKEMCISQFNWN